MYSWIDNYVTGLTEYYNTKDVFELYDCLEINIIRLDRNSPLLKGNEAVYYRSFFDSEAVFIRNDLTVEYEKFVLAHELGHAIIHTDINISAFNSNLINKYKIEKQANNFALKLLDLDIDKVDYEGFTIEQIASSFNLPKDCLKLLL